MCTRIADPETRVNEQSCCYWKNPESTRLAADRQSPGMSFNPLLLQSLNPSSSYSMVLNSVHITLFKPLESEAWGHALDYALLGVSSNTWDILPALQNIDLDQ